METFGYNTFFTLDEAAALASRRHEECRKAWIELGNHGNIRTKGKTRPFYISHGTLLELKGMCATLNVTPDYDANAVHITVPERKWLRTRRGFQFHYWAQDIELNPIDEPLAGVGAIQAVCQMAQYVDLQSLIVAMDWLTCRNPDLRVCSHQDLVDYIEGCGRFTGIRKCREAVKLSKEGTDSPQESVLRYQGNRYGLPEPEVNYEIFDHIRGSGVLSADIAYPEDHVIIEYDGRYHYTMDRWESDLDKRNRLRALGWQPFVATHATLATEENLRDFLRMVAQEIMEYRRYGHFG